jgi:hypothetical protein
VSLVEKGKRQNGTSVACSARIASDAFPTVKADPLPVVERTALRIISTSGGVEAPIGHLRL